ncbi:MAG: XdhC family protein [Candidatus Cloacimonetes bacterium]|nr:XdhC family protein [Candidatus Cloacimonadota bacterium]
MDITEKIYLLKNENKRFIVGTLVEASGSSPGKTGFKMIIQENGKTFGTVGGGNLEMLVIKDGLEMLRCAENGLKNYNLSKKTSIQKNEIDTGMICGGTAKIYFESITPKFEVYIFGGGHIAQALTKILNKQKYKIFIIDNRKEFVSEKIHPRADERIHANYDEFTQKFKPSQDSYIIIITHGHKHDYEILKNIYQRKLEIKYVGMIGSKNKVTANLKKLKSEIGDVDLKNLYSPIGLDIGGDIPSEIALSIAAEMQSIEFQKKSFHMK